MSKKSFVVMVVVAFVMSLGLGVAISKADNGPAEIKLNADGKKPATFPHAKHQAKFSDCGTCHHKAVDGKRVPMDVAAGDKPQACDSCHNADFPNEKLRKWKDIGHGLCKACHTKMKAEGAPTKCGECHKK